jgi:hypothetical protein
MRKETNKQTKYFGFAPRPTCDLWKVFFVILWHKSILNAMFRLLKGYLHEQWKPCRTTSRDTISLTVGNGDIWFTWSLAIRSKRRLTRDSTDKMKSGSRKLKQGSMLWFKVCLHKSCFCVAPYRTTQCEQSWIDPNLGSNGVVWLSGWPHWANFRLHIWWLFALIVFKKLQNWHKFLGRFFPSNLLCIYFDKKEMLLCK